MLLGMRGCTPAHCIRANDLKADSAIQKRMPAILCGGGMHALKQAGQRVMASICSLVYAWMRK